MPERIPALLEQVLGEVLQDAAYLFAMPDDGPPRWREPVVSARIAFESAKGGTLRLTAPSAVAAEIAANMLGVDASDPDAGKHGRDAMAEVLNVIGGAFVTRYFGTGVQSQLGLPSAEVLRAPPGGRTTAAALFAAESGDPVLLELDMD